MLRPAPVAGLLPLALVLTACSTTTAPFSAPPATVTASTSPAPSVPAPATASTPMPTPTPAPTPRAAPPTKPAAPQEPTCADVADDLSLAELVGQTIMVAQSATRPSASGHRTIERLHLGSVVLLGNSTAGRAATARLTGDLSRDVGAVHGVRLLVAADQEGGLVQRLQGPGFDRVASARTQAGWSDQTLRLRSETWSEQLDRAGIDLDLAPVADVVPSSVGRANAPIGALDRGYGPSPSVVARKTTAVIKGMHAGGTATTAKHFPGLGRVQGNTDTTARVVDRTTTRDDELLAGFRADVENGTEVVMISSATYTEIDPDRPATYSATVIHDMLRRDLGFRGVVVSDDLLGQALASTPVRSRGVRFLHAGGDLALVGSASAAVQVQDGLLDRARADKPFRVRVRQSATRVLELKSRQGLVSCRVSD